MIREFKTVLEWENIWLWRKSCRFSNNTFGVNIHSLFPKMMFSENVALCGIQRLKKSEQSNCTTILSRFFLFVPDWSKQDINNKQNNTKQKTAMRCRPILYIHWYQIKSFLFAYCTFSSKKDVMFEISVCFKSKSTWIISSDVTE